MKQEIKIKYFNPELKIGLVSWREAYFISPSLIPLHVETYKGRIIYRQKGSAKRISYNKLKKQLRKSDQVFVMDVPSWLYQLSPHTSPKKNPHQT
jgi:hypothetical protein